jgi:hypothetical protein
MAQLDMDGNEPRSERLLALIYEMHKDGYFSDLAVGREARRRGYFPEGWEDSLADKAAALEVSRVAKDPGKEGVPPSISTKTPHQFRLIDWADAEELDENIFKTRVPGIMADIRATRYICNLRMRKFADSREAFIERVRREAPLLLTELG